MPETTFQTQCVVQCQRLSEQGVQFLEKFQTRCTMSNNFLEGAISVGPVLNSRRGRQDKTNMFQTHNLEHDTILATTDKSKQKTYPSVTHMESKVDPFEPWQVWVGPDDDGMICVCDNYCLDLPTMLVCSNWRLHT